MGRKIVLIIPSHNNRQWYARNLASVFAQDYNEKFRAIYIDDGSSDGTGELVQEYIAERNSGAGALRSLSFITLSVPAPCKIFIIRFAAVLMMRS
jgi:glycosyltransferase involved in cell wall biosynthesis